MDYTGMSLLVTAVAGLIGNLLIAWRTGVKVAVIEHQTNNMNTTLQKAYDEERQKTKSYEQLMAQMTEAAAALQAARMAADLMLAHAMPATAPVPAVVIAPTMPVPHPPRATDQAPGLMSTPGVEHAAAVVEHAAVEILKHVEENTAAIEKNTARTNDTVQDLKDRKDD